MVACCDFDEIIVVCDLIIKLALATRCKLSLGIYRVYKAYVKLLFFARFSFPTQLRNCYRQFLNHRT